MKMKIIKLVKLLSRIQIIRNGLIKDIKTQYNQCLMLKKLMKQLKNMRQKLTQKNLLKNWFQSKKNDSSWMVSTQIQHVSYCIINDVTPQIIAMGYPADNFESIYRNPLEEVQKFLNTRHPKLYKVFNLCSERQYKHELFYKVAEFPFDDHQPPPFQLILPFCLTMQKWLKKPNRIAAVHCKAGKGRTGTMIGCYLLFSKQYESSRDALKYFAMIRTQNQEGVTIPSQARYVEYFNIAIKTNMLYFPVRAVELIEIKLYGLPNFGIFGGCKPQIRIQNQDKQLIQQPTVITNQDQQDEYCAIFRFQEIYLSGDVLVQVFHQSIVLEQKMFQAWLHTSFIVLHPQVEVFHRNELDEVVKDRQYKKFPKNFKLEIIFDKIISIRRRSNCIK